MFRPEDFAELTTPAVPNRKGNIFLMARLPLLCEEGNSSDFKICSCLNFGFVKYVDADTEQFSASPFHSYEKADAAVPDPTDTQDNDAEFPKRPVVVPEGKIQAVEAVINPAFDPPRPRVPCGNPAQYGIDVEPRSIRIAKPDAQR